MVAMMMMTFLFFFCFVVNVGMLVNAKIQLQNAADLAAYAGAAVQARQLNTVSYLNYEMRRQYKKFLFRYYVFGNMAQKQFPTSAAGNPPSTPYDWSPDASQSNAPHFNVPAVCLIFNSNDNYCQVNNLPKIKIPAATNFDMINDALRNSLANLEKLRQDNCGKIALTNMYTLALWLYSGNPDSSPDFQLTSLGPQYANAQQIVDGIVKGLGLVPREVLLRLRLQTMEGYLNEPAKSVTSQTVDSLLSSGDPHRYERSIQAFKSAFYTLGDHTFTSDGVVMEELQTNPQIHLVDNNVKFDTWAIYFDKKPTSGTVNPDNIGQNCDPHLVPQSMKSEVTVGVSKDPKYLTYYAVRLKAKAKLLFNPWGSDGVELRAYSAAQPFGSRVGPDLKTEAWVRRAQPEPNLISSLINITNSDSIVGQVPNLPISENDNLDLGWNSKEVLGTMLATAFPSSGGAKQIGPQDLARAYQLAMAPNPYETKFYNIPNDLETTPLVHSPFDATQAAIYWAPLAPPDNPGDLDGKLKSTIDDLFHEVDATSSQLKDTLKDQLGKYVGGLSSVTDLTACGTAKLAASIDDGDCESFNMVRIANPLRPRPMASNSGGSAGLLQLPAWFMPQTAKEVLTSWNAPNDPPPSANAGRMGYSVKFIAFDSLINGKVGTDSKNRTPLTNPPGAGDDEAKIDMTSIQH